MKIPKINLQTLRGRVSVYLAIASYVAIIAFMASEIYFDYSVSYDRYLLLASILGAGLGLTTLQQSIDKTTLGKKKLINEKEKMVKNYEEEVEKKALRANEFDNIVDKKLQEYKKISTKE